jgi:CRISPR-associated endonuclease Csn1
VVPINSTTNAARHGVDAQGQPNAYKGYIGGSNYCIEVWRDEKGKWRGDVISTYQAYQIVRQLGEAEGIKRLRHPRLSQQEKTLVMRLMINDLVALEIDGRPRIMRVAVISQNGQIFFSDHNEANVDARNRDKEDAFKYVSKMAGSMQSVKGRQVTVSEIGDLRDPGFKG